MGWGKVYEVENSASQLLRDCKTKADWYEVMGTLDLEGVPQLDAEDSIRFWGSKFREIVHPAEKFFVGDLHAEYDEFDDPNVAFNGAESVQIFLSQLDALGKSFFASLFPHDEPFGVGESWLYDPLCSFLRNVCLRGKAVILLWEN